MSTKGIFTAVSGAIAQDKRLETIANNIANVNTTAFKKDGQAFREYLTVAEKEQDVIQVPRVPASTESFYDMQAGDRGYVDQVETYTKHSQGALKRTGNQFDFAIEGEGFFEVLTPQGIQYTRNGSLSMDTEGNIITGSGHKVLSPGVGENRAIQISPRAKIEVNSQGAIFQNGQPVNQLSVVSFVDLNQLQKTGESYFKLRPNADTQTIATPPIVLHQGYLESSNVNVVQEMTDMISATRTFESLQKAIQAYDSMNEKLNNVVGKF